MSRKNTVRSRTRTRGGVSHREVEVGDRESVRTTYTSKRNTQKKQVQRRTFEYKSKRQVRGGRD